jgi:hypothetical protein
MISFRISGLYGLLGHNAASQGHISEDDHLKILKLVILEKKRDSMLTWAMTRHMGNETCIRW